MTMCRAPNPEHVHGMQEKAALLISRDIRTLGTLRLLFHGISHTPEYWSKTRRANCELGLFIS